MPRRNHHRLNVEGLARHGVMQNLPNKPEVMLRIDDLLIFAATMPVFIGTSLGRSKRELLPFVRRIKAWS